MQVQLVLGLDDRLEVLLRRVYLDPLAESADVVDQLLVLELDPLLLVELLLLGARQLLVGLIILLHFLSDPLHVHSSRGRLILEDLHILAPQLVELLVDELAQRELYQVEVLLQRVMH